MFGAKAGVRRSEAMNVVIDRAGPRELCAVLTLLTKANLPSEGVAEHWRLT